MSQIISRGKFLSACILSLLCMLMVFPVTAQQAEVQIEDLFDKELTRYELEKDFDFQAQTQLVTGVPFEDEFLEYNIRLPNDWMDGKAAFDGALINDVEEILEDDEIVVEEEKEELGKGFLRDITQYQSPPGVNGIQSFFTLHAEGLSNYSNADRWLKDYLRVAGVNVLGYESFTPEEASALYVRVIDGGTYIVRSRAFQNGARIIFGRYYLPQSAWQSDRGLQNTVIDSLTIPNKDYSAFENLTQHEFLDIATFSYPESWEIRNTPISVLGRIEERLRNLSSEGAVKGEIYIKIIAADEFEGLETELGSIRQEMDRLNMRYSEKPITVDHDMRGQEGTVFSVSELYEARLKKTRDLDFEVHIGMLSSASHYFLISMLTPSKEIDFFNWSENKNAFRTVFETIKNL